MARGAHLSCHARSAGRVLVPAVTAVLLLLIPATTAGATTGTSEWPTPGGSSTWAVDPDPGPGAATTSEATLEPDPTADPDIVESPPEIPVAIEPEGQLAVLAGSGGIVFPVAGHATYSASFGAPRPGGRTHEGVDIFAEKLTPVLAAAPGTVSFVRNGVGTDCCLVRIRHDDGWSSLYLHLNNDTPGTDDGLGYGIAEGIDLGVRVEAGTVIGFVGDSGNAEETPSHLHFELSDPSGTELDPYPYLQIAQGAEPALFASALLAQPETLPDTGLPAGVLFLFSLGLLTGGAMLAGGSRRSRLSRIS